MHTSANPRDSDCHGQRRLKTSVGTVHVPVYSVIGALYVLNTDASARDVVEPSVPVR